MALIPRSRPGTAAEVPTLVRTRIYPHVSFDLIREVEEAIIATTDWPVVDGLPDTRFLNRAGLIINVYGRALERRIRRLGWRISTKNYLTIGYCEAEQLAYKSFPHFYLPGAVRMIWLYDAWPEDLPNIEHVFRRSGINLAFLSSRQARDYFRKADIPNFLAFWVPEAVTVKNYRFKPAARRRIDVLQLGRRWERYHKAIVEPSARQGLNYVYQKKARELIFPTREEFIEGMASAKISVCVPRSVTHPHEAGDIATTTWRYFQSMASKCLILGLMPEEMKSLFSYSPVVAVDLERPFEQLLDVLANYHRYLDLIETNYAEVSRSHQWPSRLEQIHQGLIAFKDQSSPAAGIGLARKRTTESQVPRDSSTP